MSWDKLPAHLEKRIVCEISTKDKIANTKVRKYRNNKPVAYDRTWDSNEELNRYEELLLCVKSGDIKELEVQPKFLLLDTLRMEGETLCKRYYIADFKYFCNSRNKHVVEDVKSVITKNAPVYRLKRHMFLKLYGNGYLFLET